MNANLKLDLDLKQVLPALRRAQPYIFGLALIGVFAYTSYEVNAALNVQPAAGTAAGTTTAAPAAGATPAAAPAASGTAAPATAAQPKIVFDKPTIEALKKLDVVEATIPAQDLGKNDPFN